MSLGLPEPIAAYFKADASNAAALVDCFTPDGIVVDEQETHRGRDAIARWKAHASSKYDYVSEPISIENKDGKTIVTARLTGNFPGSPVDLRYAFTLAGNSISRLEIYA
jgi:hypothetical protein